MATQSQARGFGLGWVYFSALAFGQIVSLLGSQLTSFVFGIWIYQRTGLATNYALITFFTITPVVVVSSFSGALVDRWDRRWVLILTDAGAALTTVVIFLLFRLEMIQAWHVYVSAAVSSVLSAFQIPAYESAVASLVPKESYGRANGIAEFGGGLVRIGAPALAGWLLGAIGVEGVILIDFATFLFAVSMTLAIRIPEPEKSAEGREAQGHLFSEATYGLKYCWRSPGRVALLLFFALSNFLQGLVLVVFVPMVLSFTTPEVLGRIVSIALSGLMVGSLFMIVSGGGKRYSYGVLAGQFGVGLAMVAFGLRPWPVLITLAGFVFWAFTPILDGSELAIWQKIVPGDIQGRVFASRRLVTWSTLPVAFLLAGPLADRVFEPLFAQSGPLSGSVLELVFGLGPSRGIGFMLAASGLLSAGVAVAGFLYAPLRRVEDRLEGQTGGGEVSA